MTNNSLHSTLRAHQHDSNFNCSRVCMLLQYLQKANHHPSDTWLICSPPLVEENINNVGYILESWIKRRRVNTADNWLINEQPVISLSILWCKVCQLSWFLEVLVLLPAAKWARERQWAAEWPWIQPLAVCMLSI